MNRNRETPACLAPGGAEIASQVSAFRVFRSQVANVFRHDLSPRELQEFHEAVGANYSLISNITGVEIYRRRPLQNK